MGPNLVSMAGLALGRGTRWIMMHHIGHRGYDKVPDVPARYTSKVFARGARRFIDWADWMVPEAWIYEHNVLHHSYTGEERDPDLLERNIKPMRDADWPMPLKYLTVFGLAVSWRFYYYAPSTLRTWLDRHESKDESSRVSVDVGHEKELWLKCYLPYAGLHFVLFPALYLPLGPLASLSALVNSVGAEALCNLHTFSVITPNHTGDDLYRFDTRPASKGEAMVRQIVGSTNFATGTEPIDYAHLLARPADAEVSPGGAEGEGALREARDSVHAGERICAREEGDRYLRREDVDAASRESRRGPARRPARGVSRGVRRVRGDA
jgi:hypothetical protein